jgi:hypothetical protein
VFGGAEMGVRPSAYGLLRRDDKGPKGLDWACRLEGRAPEHSGMASRIYPADQPGHRYEFTSRRLVSETAMQITIGPNRYEPFFTFTLERTDLKRIKMSFQPMSLGDGAEVRYQVGTRSGVPRAGFQFEFRDGEDERSVFVAAEAMEWLMSNPDSDVFLERGSLSPWETGLLPC